jgi:hypothetical protein
LGADGIEVGIEGDREGDYSRICEVAGEKAENVGG